MPFDEYKVSLTITPQSVAHIGKQRKGHLRCRTATCAAQSPRHGGSVGAPANEFEDDAAGNSMAMSQPLSGDATAMNRAKRIHR